MVLNTLADGVDRGQPMTDQLRSLAEVYPRRNTSARLGRACNNVQQGADWIDSLVHQKLVRAPDAEVLRSAERLENLSWALREVAAISIRRVDYGSQLVRRIGVPVALLVLSLPIGWFVASMIAPLAQLVQNMS